MSAFPDPDALVQQALEHVKAGLRAESRQCLLDALATDPKHPGALWGLANITTQPDERRAALTTLLEVDASHTQARDMLNQLNAAHPPDKATSVPPPPPEVKAVKPSGGLSLRWMVGGVVIGLLVVAGIVLVLIQGNGAPEGSVAERTDTPTAAPAAGPSPVPVAADDVAATATRTCRVLPSEVTSFFSVRYNRGVIVYNPVGRVQAEVLWHDGADPAEPWLVIVRDIDTGAEFSRAEVAGGPLCTGECYLAQDGQFLVDSWSEFANDTGRYETVIATIDTRTGERRLLLDGREETALFASRIDAAAPELLLVYANNANLTQIVSLDVLDARSGARVAELAVPPDLAEVVSAPAFGPEQDAVLLVERDTGMVQRAALYALPSGELIRRFGQAASAAAYSPDGRLIATGHWGHGLTVYDALSGEVLDTPIDPLKERALASGLVSSDTWMRTENITGLAFSPDGRRLAVSSETTLFYVWEWETGAAWPVYAAFDVEDVMFTDEDTLHFSYFEGMVACSNFIAPGSFEAQQVAVVGRWNFEPMGTPASDARLDITGEILTRSSESDRASDARAYFWWDNFQISVDETGLTASEVLGIDSGLLQFGPLHDPMTLARDP